MYSEYAAAIRDYFNQNQARFISGEQDVNDDAVWEEYKAGFEGLGLDEYLRIKGVETIAE